MKLVETTDALVTFLRGTIPTPHSTNQNWIYPDYPRPDATFPRISITQTGGNLAEIGIGERTSGLSLPKGKLASIDYDIDIWVGMDSRATYNTVIYVGTKLRDYLTDLVLTSLEDGKQLLKTTYGFLDIETVGITTSPLEEELHLHRKTVSLRVTFIWEEDW